MMINMDETAKRYKELVDIVFGSEAGRELLKLLKEEYVFRSVATETPVITYYHLGKQELIKHFEDVLNADDYLERLEILKEKYQQQQYTVE